ncbi:MAG: PIN domain-containing protein [Spirochaetia bacterium]|jgi:predicted nucleic acid-binding protein|nr:PIN domain-containing protein [Spirochaetia bacterium]
MGNRIFVDSDVLLDILLERIPHFDNSQKILALVEKCVFQGFTSSLILANCFYIIENSFSRARAVGAVQKIRSIMEVLPFSDKEIGESLSSNIADFEDGIQYFIASNNNVNTIITRNIKDYSSLDCRVFTPGDFINLQNVKRMIEDKTQS